MKKSDFAGWTTIENVPSWDFREGHPQFFRVRNLFALVTYKPGTRIVVEPERSKVCISIWIPTVDSNHQDVPYEGRFFMTTEYELIAQQTDEELITWLMRNVAAFETHEVMEFFKVAGKHVRNPHPWEDPTQGDYMHDCAKIYRLEWKEEKLEV